MAQNLFLNITVGAKNNDGAYAHSPVHGTASTGDMTISWDSTKFTKREAFQAALKIADNFVRSRGDLT